MRIFVNGTQVQNVGAVADNPEDFVPSIGYMTRPVFTGETGRVKIIFQYTNFVHQKGGTERHAHCHMRRCNGNGDN